MAARPASAFPRASRSLNISFGLVNVGVGIAPMMGESTTSAKLLDPVKKLPVKQRYQSEDGDLYGVAECVKGYEYGGEFVVMEDADLKGLEVLSDGAIKLTACVSAGEIDPAYFEKSYLLWPKPGFEQAYDLLSHGLRTSARALVGQCVMTKSTRMLVIRWSFEFGCLVAHVCHYGANVRSEYIAKVTGYTDTRPEPDQEALDLVEALFDSLDQEFDPDSVTDTYTAALDAAIAARAEGRGIVIEPEPDGAPLADDFMAALKAQVESTATPA